MVTPVVVDEGGDEWLAAGRHLPDVQVLPTLPPQLRWSAALARTQDPGRW